MRSFVLIAFCFFFATAASAGIEESLSKILSEVHNFLVEHDPLQAENFDVTVLGIELKGDSASLSGFSDDTAQLTVDEESGKVSGEINVGEISAEIKNLAITSDIIDVTLSSLSGSGEGITFTFDAVFDEDSNKVTSFSSLLKLGNIKGTVTVNISGSDLDLEVDLSEYIDVINTFLADNQEQLNKGLLYVVNGVICALA